MSLRGIATGLIIGGIAVLGLFLIIFSFSEMVNDAPPGQSIAPSAKIMSASPSVPTAKIGTPTAKAIIIKPSIAPSAGKPPLAYSLTIAEFAIGAREIARSNLVGWTGIADSGKYGAIEGCTRDIVFSARGTGTATSMNIEAISCGYSLAFASDNEVMSLWERYTGTNKMVLEEKGKKVTFSATSGSAYFETFGFSCGDLYVHSYYISDGQMDIDKYRKMRGEILDACVGWEKTRKVAPAYYYPTIPSEKYFALTEDLVARDAEYVARRYAADAIPLEQDKVSSFDQYCKALQPFISKKGTNAAYEYFLVFMQTCVDPYGNMTLERIIETRGYLTGAESFSYYQKNGKSILKTIHSYEGSVEETHYLKCGDFLVWFRWVGANSESLKSSPKSAAAEMASICTTNEMEYGRMSK